MSENTKLWDAVCKTDPSMTKRVTLRGGFTSICAHWQVQRATEQFGPLGVGWGYDVVYSTVTVRNVVYPKVTIEEMVLQVADVTLWHGSRENRYGPIRGCSPLLNTSSGLDDDAAKKAMTDALTKGLSHLGFSAHVFLGKFDDNKYVAAMKKEFADENAAPPDPHALANGIKAVHAAKSVGEACRARTAADQAVPESLSATMDRYNIARETAKAVHAICTDMVDGLTDPAEVAKRQAVVHGKLDFLTDGERTEINDLFELRKKQLDRPTHPPA